MKTRCYIFNYINMNLVDYIRDVPDFPQKWIVFKDITPLLLSPDAFSYAIDEFSKNMVWVDVIVGLDARGFILWGAVAYKLWLPFVPVRKKEKLPHEVISESYSLEYGVNTFEMHADAIKKWQKVAMIDDLLATGGSMRAACNLVETLWWEIVSTNFLVELAFLWWRGCLDGYKKNTLITYF